MPNPENVIGKGNRFRTNEEATINGRKGGLAAGRKRREKRDAMEIAKMVLDFHPDVPDQMLETMKRMGMGGKGKPDMRLISTLAITQKAMKGDANAYKFLTEMAGETPEAKLMAAKAAESVRHTGLMNAQMLSLDMDKIREKMDSLSDEDLQAFEHLCSLFSDIETDPPADTPGGEGE